MIGLPSEANAVSRTHINNNNNNNNNNKTSMSTNQKRFYALLSIYLMEQLNPEGVTNEEFDIAQARATKARKIMDKFWPEPKYVWGLPSERALASERV